MFVLNPRRQAHLKKDTVPALKAAVPDLTDDDLEVMQEVRTCRPEIEGV